MNLLLILGGLGALFVSAEALQHGATATARRLGVSSLFIGLTLGALFASAPEFAIAVRAAAAGAPELAVGVAVGGNIANFLLVIGFLSVLTPIACRGETYYRDALVILLAVLIFTTLALMVGEIGRFVGGLFVVGLIAHVGFAYLHEIGNIDEAARLRVRQARAVNTSGTGRLASLALLFGGGAGLVAGGWLTVAGAQGLADAWGVSHAFLGVTILALGAAAPELALGVIAWRRKESCVALGGVIGSNIFNIFGVLGVAALIRPLPIPGEMLFLDVWAMLVGTLMLVFFAMTNERMSRVEGAILLGGFVLYLAFRIGDAVGG